MEKRYYTFLTGAVLLSILAACGGGGSGDNNESGGFSGDNGASLNSPSTTPELPEEQAIESGATEFFFSYDDSASTASRDLTLFAINNGNNISQSWGRPYEFLNAENFSHFEAEEKAPFSVSMGLYKATENEIPLQFEYEGDIYALGVNVSGPAMSQEERKNVVLTILVDISGSMQTEYAFETRQDIRSLLDVLKHGLLQLPNSLKSGDVLNLVTFDTEAETLLTGWEFKEGDNGFSSVVQNLQTLGSTNLNAGVTEAYRTAISTYDSEKANRVIILTDAYANTGEVDATIIAENTVFNGLEGIQFAGVGVGSGFNDAFLNELTDIGKSVYSAMVTPEDAERIFTEGFMRFIDSAVSDVKFKLTYPQKFEHLVSSAEEVSENEQEVNSTNFAFNSQQFFFELFGSVEAEDPSETFTLSVSYTDDNGDPQSIEFSKTVADLLQNQDAEIQIKSAAAVTSLASLVAGKLRCQAVVESGLYEEEIETLVFTHYKNAISRFCGF